MAENILEAIFIAIPSIMSIASAIGVLINVYKNYKEIREELHNRNDYNELKQKLDAVAEENIELKKAIFEFIEYSKKHPVIKSKED